LQPREIGAERRSGRARQFGGKATDCACWTGDAAQDTPGGWRTARSDSLVRNRRGPTWQPTSGEDRAYKAKPKSHGARRESEGPIVPMKAVRSRWREGALLWSCGERGKREGMVAERPNNPIKKRDNSSIRYAVVPSERWRVEETPSFHAEVTTRRGGASGLPPVVHAHGRRPSVSRMREIRTYGLNGGDWRRGR